jgi:tetratricopeptide (TPR) repeat protein
MKFIYGGAAARRYRILTGEDVFVWQPQRRDDTPVFRDLAWDFEEPDQYPALVAGQKPGMMASKGEKAFHAAVTSGVPADMLATAGQHPKWQSAANAIAGLLMLESDLDRGMEVLEAAIGDEEDVGKNHFVHKYLPEAGLSVVIAAGVMVHLPLQRNSLVLLLAELHQARGDAPAAIAILEAAEATTHIRLSLTELLFETEQFERVVAVTQGVANDDDVTALTLAYRGRALTELGRDDEAIAALARALEYPNRAESVKAIALVGRGTIHQRRGEHILAQNDFTQALMEVPDDEEAIQHIQQLIHGESPGG